MYRRAIPNICVSRLILLLLPSFSSSFLAESKTIFLVLSFIALGAKFHCRRHLQSTGCHARLALAETKSAELRKLAHLPASHAFHSNGLHVSEIFQHPTRDRSSPSRARTRKRLIRASCGRTCVRRGSEIASGVEESKISSDFRRPAAAARMRSAASAQKDMRVAA